MKDIKYDEIILDKYLEYSSLNICGKIDLAFVCKNEVIAVEFKNIEANNLIKETSKLEEIKEE